jgi:UDPglucose--hexose-1-phosphate uridylyltransferase
LDTGERLVYQNEDIVVVAPYASRMPFELWFLPRGNEPWYEHAQPRTYFSLAGAVRVVCRKLNVALDEPPYNLVLHSAPFADEDMSHFRWHLELIPKIKKIGGFEWATGFHINPTPPEEAARHLREIEI